MKKLLILVLMLSLIVGLNIISPDKPRAQDTTKIFVSSSAWLTIPALKGAANFDPAMGIAFGGEKILADGYFSVGGHYQKWQINGENGTSDTKGEFMAVRTSYWIQPFGSKYNICINFVPGYSKVVNGSITEDQFGMASSVGLSYCIFPGAHLRLNWGIGKYGDDEQDAFNVDLGLIFKVN